MTATSGRAPGWVIGSSTTKVAPAPGDTAVAALADVLLVDLRMPGLDGSACSRRLAGHGLVKVLVSASLDDDVARRAAAAGANACRP